MKVIWKRYGKILGAVLIAVLFWIIWNTFQLLTFSTHDEKRPADAVIVLGAGVHGDQPSAVFRERINHGIWLYENGYADVLIFTGGTKEEGVPTEASVAKNYAMEKGVPGEAIRVEERSRITLENLEYTKEIMEAEGLDDAVLVSDPLHMKRSVLMARDLGLTVYSSPTPTTRFQSFGTQLPFFGRELFFYTGYQVYRWIPFLRQT